MTVASVPDSIMLRLRSDTRAHHDAAENTLFQRRLMAGSLPLDRYVESLAQLLPVHRALDAQLRRAAEHAPVAAVVRERHYQEPYLLEDLAWFQRDPDRIEASPAARDMVASIERAAAGNPLAILGFHYVIEGSKNGGKILAERVRAAYDLPPGRGTRYLDPYGDSQRPWWAEFRAAMDGLKLTPDQAAAILSAARACFDGITRLYQSLLPDEPVA